MVKRYDPVDATMADFQYGGWVEFGDYAGVAKLANKAIAVCQRYLPPGGIGAFEAMAQIVEIFDSPEQRAAMAVPDGDEKP